MQTFTCKQSKAEHAPALPSRAILVGASGEGKTHLLTELLTNQYRGCFEAIYLWSPSIHVDPGYDKIKEYVETKLKPDDQWMFDSYESDELQDIIDQQASVIRLMKQEKRRKMYSIAICIDDFSDTPEFTRNSRQLWSLFARGRHMFISTFVLSQRWRSLAPIVRLNASVVYIHRLRNAKDIIAISEELGGERGQAEIYDAIRAAINDQPHSYLMVDLMSKQWMIRMERYV